jgi:hypothetical protein
MSAPAEQVDELRMRSLILSHMQPGETLKQSLKRLSIAKSKSTSATFSSGAGQRAGMHHIEERTNLKLIKKNVRKSVIAAAEQKKAEEAAKAKTQTSDQINDDKSGPSNDLENARVAAEHAFNSITEAAVVLSSTGNFSIYSEKYEQILHIVNALKRKRDFELQAARNHAANQDPNQTYQNLLAKASPNAEFYYKWTLEDTQVHGPMNCEQMTNWHQQGYFKSGKVVVKMQDDENISIPWTRINVNTRFGGDDKQQSQQSEHEQPVAKKQKHLF